MDQDAYFVRHDSLGVADGVGGWNGKKGADPGLFAARLMHRAQCHSFLSFSDCLISHPIYLDCSAEIALYEDTTGKSSTSATKLSFVSSSTSSNPTSGVISPGSHTSSSSSTIHTSTEPVGEDSRSTSKFLEGDPIEVLHKAWDATLTEFCDLELIGSTTALVALLKNDELRLANLGDCCCSIIRDKDYIFRSQEQQHSFNYPYQMGTNSQDTPRKDGQRFNIKVRKDDIVILSSDGLVDNLFDEDILEEVLTHSYSPQALSQALCSRAKAVSEDQRAVTSPFQQRANEEGIHFVGGKHDDISVLVAVIGDGEHSASGSVAIPDTT